MCRIDRKTCKKEQFLISRKNHPKKSNFMTFFSAMGNNGGRPPNNLSGSSNLSSSFNSGLNTYGLNNSYGNTNGFSSGANSLNNSPQFNTTNNGLGNYHQKKEVPAWLGMI